MVKQRKVCPQPQCHSAEPKTRHSGYVRHLTRKEPPCLESLAGHAIYTQTKRKAKKGKK